MHIGNTTKNAGYSCIFFNRVYRNVAIGGLEPRLLKHGLKYSPITVFLKAAIGHVYNRVYMCL